MAHFSLIIPHYKTWKMSFYAIHQVLKHRGRHQIDLYVADNNPSDGTAENLKFFGDKIKVLPYPADRMQSHGIAYDWVIPRLRTELFVTMESDSFPTEDGWLDIYEAAAQQGFSSAGSYLDLSGGSFVHTAGAFYKKSVWQQAKRYVDNIEYAYFPSIAMKEDFPCHLLVHHSVLDQFEAAPGNYVTLYKDYLENPGPAYLRKKLIEYLPIGKGVFHNGAGSSQEAYSTYRFRNHAERLTILMDNKQPLIWRMGMEPGQYFHYWLLANGHNVFNIPTEVIWMPNRENQQQERTVMQNGFVHLWAVTAYNEVTSPELKDIVDYKKNMMEELYHSIPDNERI